jgi:Ca-activated chloride channel family protein
MKLAKYFSFISVLCILLFSLACTQQAAREEKTAEEQITQPKPPLAKPVKRPLKLKQVKRPRPVVKSSPRMMMSVAMAPPPMRDRERYQEFDPNPVKQALKDPVSTFSIDVDTGSYANVRRFFNQGRKPPSQAVRVEEMINYFSYNYPAPQKGEAPFALSAEAAPCPWNRHTVLLRLGLKGYELDPARRPAANLVFLLDVSGSMGSQYKLPLLKSAFKLLVRQLSPKDRVSIVVYAGAAGVVLEPTPGNEHAKIITALERLKAGGSTAGGQGIQLAYAMAKQAFIKGGGNRVLLATDGDFNVGVTSTSRLLDLVKQERQSGVSLSTLGFGRGNYNEEMMERLADAGNGNYSYIDNLSEANKVLVQQLSSNLFNIAQDVKLQVEFNPAVVAEYRLIGYENRMLKREDFKNDKVDAGDIGAGHTVTAIYELALVGSEGLTMEPLRYTEQNKPKGNLKELGYLKMRYKLPGEKKSKLLQRPLAKTLIYPEIADASDDFRWAVAVAGFGQLLRGGKYLNEFSYDEVLNLARKARGDDPYGNRGEFVKMVGLAKSLQ